MFDSFFGFFFFESSGFDEDKQDDEVDDTDHEHDGSHKYCQQQYHQYKSYDLYFIVLDDVFDLIECEITDLRVDEFLVFHNLIDETFLI